MNNYNTDEDNNLSDNVKSDGKLGLFSSTTRKQKFLLLSMVWVEFTNFCALSILAPFFPIEAGRKGMSQTTTGLVFSCYAFMLFITSPIWGKLIPLLGIKFILISGAFIAGSCNVLFGLLSEIQNPTTFTIFCFLVRSIEAAGASAYITGCFTLMAQEFPGKLGVVMGIIETALSLGLSLGPAIGGVLFSLGGYFLPFLVLGLALLTNVPILYVLLPNNEHKEMKSVSMMSLFKSSGIVVTAFTIFIASLIWTFIEPTLANHLIQFDLSPSHIGLVFLLCSGVYALSCPFWGQLCDRMNKNGWILLVIGFALLGLALLLLGPSPLLPFLPNTLWLTIVSLGIFGIFCAPVFLPTYQNLLNYSLDMGLDDSIGTYSVVGGLWNSMFSLGEIAGPSLGSYLVDLYGFPFCSTVMAFICGFMVIFLLIYFLCKAKCKPTRKQDEESKPLL